MNEAQRTQSSVSNSETLPGRADHVRLVWVYAHRCAHTTADAILGDIQALPVAQRH